MPVDRIHHHPGLRQPGVQDPGQHLLRPRRLGRERCIRGQAHRRQTRRIVRPAAGQIDLSIPPRHPPETGVGQEDPDLAVLDAPRRPPVLGRRPRRMSTLLQKPCLVDKVHPVGVRQVVLQIGVEGVPHPIRRPVGPAQQVRDAAGVGLPLDLGQLPAVLAGRGAEGTLHIGP